MTWLSVEAVLFLSTYWLLRFHRLSNNLCCSSASPWAICWWHLMVSYTIDQTHLVVYVLFYWPKMLVVDPNNCSFWPMWYLLAGLMAKILILPSNLLRLAVSLLTCVICLLIHYSQCVCGVTVSTQWAICWNYVCQPIGLNTGTVCNPLPTC